MTETWQMTLAQFLGDYPVADPATPAEAAADDRQLRQEIEEGTEGWSRLDMRRTASPGFYIAEVRDTDSDVALIYHDRDEESWDVCGGYVGPSLWIEPGSCRGRGLAAELVAAKADLAGGKLEPISYTTAGKAAHRSGHRLAVQRALHEGYRVPRHVLEEDYPEFLPAGSRRQPVSADADAGAGAAPGPSRR